ncbi:oxygenase MpaB family protein [Williamsia sp. SKLECPSW1]
MTIRDRRITTHELPQDYGFFGPDSVTWKVWSHPAGMTVGFQRAVVIEELDPFLIAAVHDTGKIFTRPRVRYDHTLRYFAISAFGDARTAVTAADVLVRIHARAVGLEPVSGGVYNANDPAQQLWIHLTAWHSILYAYEVYGPGPLTTEEETEYWEQCAIAAELQTCDPADVPRTREGVREYFAAMRPRLAASSAAQHAMRQLLDAEVMFPPTPPWMRPGAALINRVLRSATLATMPRWQRELAGMTQPRAIDAAVRPVMKIAFRLVASNARVELRLLKWISPGTYPIVKPVLEKAVPVDPRTWSPQDAFAEYGVTPPPESAAALPPRRDLATLAPSRPMPVTA